MHPHTPTLLELQRLLCHDVLGLANDAATFVVADGLDPRARLAIYRNTATSTLVKALQLSYPVVQSLVGAEFFEAAARMFIEQHPPTSAYLDAYGIDLPGFLARMPEAAALVYLPDTARLEWVVNNVLHAPDTEPLELGRLARLEPAQLESLRFEPNPSVQLFQSAFPVDVIWRAVLNRDECALEQINLNTGPVWMMVRRTASGIEVERVAEWQWQFAATLLAGHAMDTAPVKVPEAEIQVWIASLLASGCFTDIHISKQARESSIGGLL